VPVDLSTFFVAGEQVGRGKLRDRYIIESKEDRACGDGQAEAAAEGQAEAKHTERTDYQITCRQLLCLQ
jgi:hypothetical protein